MIVKLNGEQAYAYTGTKALRPELPTVVMVHGAQNDHSVWILQSRYLAHHGLNVLAVDLPGHGRSSGKPLESVHAAARWIDQLLEQLKIDQASIIGHSMGSLIALELAGQVAPARCARIALLGTAYPMPVSAALLTACETDEDQAISMINQWSHSGITHSPGSPGPGFSVYVQGLRLMQRQKHGVLPVDFHACNNYAGGDVAAAQVTCPTLLLNGERDQMTAVRAARQLKDKLVKVPQGAQLQTIPDCGHALMQERPDVVLQHLKNWLGLA